MVDEDKSNDRVLRRTVEVVLVDARVIGANEAADIGGRARPAGSGPIPAAATGQRVTWSVSCLSKRGRETNLRQAPAALVKPQALRRWEL